MFKGPVIRGLRLSVEESGLANRKQKLATTVQPGFQSFAGSSSRQQKPLHCFLQRNFKELGEAVGSRFISGRSECGRLVIENGPGLQQTKATAGIHVFTLQRLAGLTTPKPEWDSGNEFTKSSLRTTSLEK